MLVVHVSFLFALFTGLLYFRISSHRNDADEEDKHFAADFYFRGLCCFCRLVNDTIPIAKYVGKCAQFLAFVSLNCFQMELAAISSNILVKISVVLFRYLFHVINP